VGGLVGVAGDGPILEPTRLTGFGAYELSFGVPIGWMAESVRGFFDNGGATLWAVRAAGPTRDELTAAIDALEDVDEIALAVCPDALALGHDEAAAVATHLAARCEDWQALAVVDLPDLESADALVEWRTAHLESDHAAPVAPFVRTADAPEGLPPSALAMGALALRDRQRGVPGSWIPDGPLVGVTALAREFAVEEVALLNGHGVNVIRSFPGAGIVVWGGRTATDDPDEKYVAVRRLLLFLEASIEQGLQWAAFEPNAELTWGEVRLAVEEFLNAVWRDGGLVGATPDEAYFVRAGLGDTMTQVEIDAGLLNVLVGVAPIRPSEFVTFTVQVSGVTP
jgi:phage tail sheath protein FI